MEPVKTEDLLRMAKLLGFDVSPAEIEEIRGQVEHGLALIERLDALPLADVEPATGFQVTRHDG